mmetsp:Transcript_47923/g.104246  ORF Transcript_47923/g.104246 Transcript_47923/m.104246 type:complete len:232 (+) Transcript_47923:813-1508(+)
MLKLLLRQLYALILCLQEQGGLQSVARLLLRASHLLIWPFMPEPLRFGQQGSNQGVLRLILGVLDVLAPVIIGVEFTVFGAIVHEGEEKGPFGSVLGSLKLLLVRTWPLLLLLLITGEGCQEGVDRPRFRHVELEELWLLQGFEEGNLGLGLRLLQLRQGGLSIFLIVKLEVCLANVAVRHQHSVQGFTCPLLRHPQLLGVQGALRVNPRGLHQSSVDLLLDLLELLLRER